MPNSATESLQIEKLQKGDILAFNFLFEEYSSRLYHFGLKFLKTESDAEELVQEVFLKIWKNKSNLKADKSFKSYLFTIAFNQIKKHFQNKTLILELTETLNPLLIDNSTENNIVYNSIKKQVETILDELPLKKKEIFCLRRFEGLSSKEVALKYGMSPGSIDNQVSEIVHFIKRRINTNEISVLLFFFLFIN